MEQSSATITLEHRNDKPKLYRIFQQEPGLALVKECDKKSKQLRSTLVADDSEDILHILLNTPICEGKIKDKAVAVLIREIDAQKFEEDYAKSKLLEKWI